MFWGVDKLRCSVDNFLACKWTLAFFEPYIEPRYIAVQYIIANWTIASVKHFYLTDSCYPTCKNTQKASYAKKHTIILYYYCMFQCGGVFTLYFIGTFAPGWGCVQLPCQLQNCIKFSHNSPNHPKFTSIVTSIKYWKSKQK